MEETEYVKVGLRTQKHPKAPFEFVSTLGVKDPPVPLPESFDITEFLRTDPTVQLQSFYCVCLAQTDKEKKAYMSFIQYLHSGVDGSREGRRYAKTASPDALFFLYAPRELAHYAHVTDKTLLYCAYSPIAAPPHAITPSLSSSSSSFNTHRHGSSLNRIHSDLPVLPPPPPPINKIEQPVMKGILKPKTPVSTVKTTVGQNKPAANRTSVATAPVSAPSSSAVRFGTSLPDRPASTSSSYSGLTFDSLLSAYTSTTPSTPVSSITSKPVTSNAVSSSTATSTAVSNVSAGGDLLANYVARGVKTGMLTAEAQHHSSWVFGAFAELIDNAYDAEASNVYLDIVEQSGMPLAIVSDDGSGMSHAQIDNMFMFGHDADEVIKDGVRIGRYGVGFKSGTMRIGKDALVLTKSKETVSMGLLSVTLNEKRQNGVLLPIVTWKRSTMEFDLSAHSKEVAEALEKLIFEHSPITNKYLLAQHFTEIKDTGTRVYVFNLQKLESKFELDWKTDSTDIRIANDVKNRLFLRMRPGQLSNDVPLDYSLKAYCEVLFLNPKANIHVRGHQIVNQRVVSQLTRTKTFKSKALGTCTVTIGYNEDMKNRGLSGVMMYWHNRLIQAYVRCGVQKTKADAALGCIGVFSCVDELNPNNNKQSFAEDPNYTRVSHFLNVSMDKYWFQFMNPDDVVIDSEAAQTRAKEHDWVQCSTCFKWRRLPVGTPEPAKHLAWYCYMNPDPTHNSCSAPEEDHDDDVTLKLSIGGIDKRELEKKKQAQEKQKQKESRKPVSSSSSSASSSSSSSSSSSRSPSPAPRTKRKEPSKALQNSALKKVKMEKTTDDYVQRGVEKQQNNNKKKKTDTTKTNNNKASKTTASNNNNTTANSSSSNKQQTFQSVSMSSTSANHAPTIVLKKRKPIETVILESDQDEPEGESEEVRAQKLKQTPNGKGTKRKQDLLNGLSTSKSHYEQEEDEEAYFDVSVDLSSSPAPAVRKPKKLRKLASDDEDD